MTIAAAAFAVAVLALAARYVRGVNLPVLVTAALVPYLALGAPAAVLLFAVAHNWIGVVLAATLTVAGIAVRFALVRRRQGRSRGRHSCRLGQSPIRTR
jgi:hypothetical protein